MGLEKNRADEKRARRKRRKKTGKKINGHFTAITDKMSKSLAWEALPHRAYYCFIRVMEGYFGNDDDVLTLGYSKVRHKMKRTKFYEAMRALVDYGFLDKLEESIVNLDLEKKYKGLRQQKKKYRKSDRWQEVSARLELADAKTLQSMRDKERAEEKQKDKELDKVFEIVAEKKEKPKKKVRKKAKRKPWSRVGEMEM